MTSRPRGVSMSMTIVRTSRRTFALKRWAWAALVAAVLAPLVATAQMPPPAEKPVPVAEHAAADAPRPEQVLAWPGPARADLAIPDALWDAALGPLGRRGQPLGYSAEEMMNYGRDAMLMRSVALLFRDARAVPRFSGKVTDDLLDAAAKPGELVQIGYRLTDVSAGRGIPLPTEKTWGVPWVPDGTPPLRAVELAMARLIGAGPNAPARFDATPLAALPEPIVKLIARLLIAEQVARPYVKAAYDEPFFAAAAGAAGGRPSLDALHRLASAPWDDEKDGQSLTLSKTSFEALRRLDREYLAYGSILYLSYVGQAIQEYRAWGDLRATREAIEAINFPGLRVATPIGEVIIGGSGDDRYTDQALLIVEIRGHDTYAGRQATPAPFDMPISTVVDLWGNDTYDSGDAAVGAACGLFGVGVLIDLDGADQYRCRRSGLGQAWFGTAFLFDSQGDDTYILREKWGLGSATAGVGVLLDGGGDDYYSCAEQAQGLGCTYGAGLLIDLAGNDRYIARDDGNVQELYKGQSVAMAQGCGYGRRADFGDGHSLAGGFGVLLDAAGDDSYSAQVWSQGCAYWWGVGILEDRAGNDTYRNGKYSLGAAAHFAVGVCVDLAGDDKYNIGHDEPPPVGAMNQYQGHARDGSIGVFIDGDGNDSYYLRNHCAGSGDLGAVGLFWDRRGNDTYTYKPNDFGAPNGWNETTPFGSATWYPAPQRTFRDEIRTFGLFLDTGGHDTYAWEKGPAADGKQWRIQPEPRSIGVGIDGEWFPAAPPPPPAHGGRSEPR